VKDAACNLEQSLDASVQVARCGPADVELNVVVQDQVFPLFARLWPSL
jgi:hypothetical protein